MVDERSEWHHWCERESWRKRVVRFRQDVRISVAAGGDGFCITYQSPLPVFRPLSPPSVDVFPAAAEAKLEVNGEGMIRIWRWCLLD